MWECHWKLCRDPFAEADAPYIATPPHAEAVARLVHAIASGQRSAILQAPAGMGKSMVLAQVLAEARRRTRCVALVQSPPNGTSLLTELAEKLGLRVSPDLSRAHAWKRLADAVRLGFLQGHSVVLAVDDSHHLTDAADRLDLARLVHLAPSSRGRLIVIQVGRDFTHGAATPLGWELAIRLVPLTRSEAEHYLLSKLRASGRQAPAFSSPALTVLHALSGGVPRGIDRLASLSLMIGASEAHELIHPKIVEGAYLECVPSQPGSPRELACSSGV
jgi:MSHA biogenesis protein MshM